MDVSEKEAASRRGGSRRFTTMEGWREVANNIYYVAGQGLINVPMGTIIDGYHLEDDEDIIHRKASHARQTPSLVERDYSASSIFGQNHTEAGNPFADPETPTREHEEKENPFSNINAIDDTNGSDHSKEKLGAVLVEEPYHIFPTRQRWYVVVTVGAAGLFSGLSSNIYFPALDIIAKVCVQATSLNIITI